MKQKIVVRGPVLSQSGYGEQARFAIRALRSREDIFDIYIIPTAWGQTGWVSSDNEERAWTDKRIAQTHVFGQQGGRFDMSLQITIPNEWENLAPVNIGYTAGIETTKVAPVWLQKANEMDKIIVVSNHSKNVFEATNYQGQNNQTGETVHLSCQTPITAVNYPVRHFEKEKLDLKLDYNFNYLAISQWGPRKNFDNLVKWFLEENFDQEVGLVLKTSVKNNSIIDREHTGSRLKSLLRSFGGENCKCKVYLVHGDLTPEEMNGLYQHSKIKALVSTAHGEGFGLPLFEAAYNGLPVIVSGWSGHCDFLYIPDPKRKGKKKPMFASVEYDLQNVQKQAVWDNVIQADSQWAFPREASFKRRLREVRSEYSRFKRNATKLKKYLIENFTEEKKYEEFVRYTIGEEQFNATTINVSLEEIPKISLITSVFDAAEHIEQLMEDVTRQTIFKEKCEWILLNANPEGQNIEEEVILKYVEKYPNNIIYKRLEDDPGIYGVWNEAIKMSTGKFITNINCDDRRAPPALEKQAKCLVSHPDVDLVYNDSYISQQPNINWESLPQNAQRYNFEQFSKEAMIRGNQPHNNPMWRKCLHEKHGLFDSKYRSAGDWEFFLRCAFGGAKFQKMSEILGIYYFNPKGISTNFENFEWKQEEEREIFTKYKTMLEDE